MRQVYAVKVYRSSVGSVLRVRLNGEIERLANHSGKWVPSTLSCAEIVARADLFKLVAKHVIFKCKT